MSALRPAILALSVGVGALASIPPAGAMDDPHKCVAVADDSARLACYDRALGRTPAAKNGAPAAPPAAAVAPPPAPAKVTTENFGLTEAQRVAKDPARAAAQPESITAKAISVGWRKYGEFVVTLDNGQVWEQLEPMPSASVKVGDTVTIKRGWLGSYMLVTAGRVGTKVRRVD